MVEVDGPAAPPADSEPSQPGPQNVEADGSGDSVAAQLLGRRLARSTSGSSAAASAPAQPRGDAGEAGWQNGGRAARPRSALAGSKGSGSSGQQAGQPAAEPAGAAQSAMAAAGSAGQQPAGGGSSKFKSGWLQDEQGWWRRTLTASACRGSASSLALPRDLFRELVGQAAEAKDQLEVVGAGGQPYSFQFTIRSDNGTCTLSGAQLGRWGADTGAQAGDSVALRRNGGHVEVRLIPASGTAAGQAAAGSPSPAPAPAAAQAGGAAARRTRRSSTEEQEQKQSRAPAAPAAAAGAGGKGSKRRSSERQEQQGGAAAAAAAAAPAAGSGKRGSKRASSERQQQGGSPASAPAAAGSTGHFPSGGTAPHKGWQMGGDGWWRRPLTASACGTSQSCVKLGFPAGFFEELTGKEADNAEDLAVVDAHTGQQLTFRYRKDLSCGGSNIMGAELSRWVADSGAQEGDFIALRRSGSKIEVRCIPAGSAAGSPGPAAAATAAGKAGTAPAGGRKGAKRRRTSSEEEGEAAEAAASGAAGTGGSKPGRAPRSKQLGAAAGQAAQQATRGAGAGAASAAAVASQGVESQLSGEELLNRRIEVLWDDGWWYAGLVVDVHHSRRGFKCEVLYDDGDRQQEPLLPGEWRLLEDDEPLAAAEQQARQATGGRRRVAAGGGKAHAKRQQLPAAEIERQLPAEEAGEEPVKKRQRKSRTAGPAAEEGAAQLADQPEAAAQQAEQEQQERQQPAKQARQRGKPAAKEAALLLEPGQDAAALVQSGRGRRKAAEAAQAGVQAALRAEQGGEVTTVTDAPLPPEVLLEQGAFAAVAAAPAVAAEAAGAAVAGAVASAAAPARQSSSQRRRASGAAKSRAAAAPPAQPPAGSAPQQAAGVAVPAAVAGPAAAAAAAGAAGPAAGEALPPCYWFEKRQAPFNQNLPREARKAELRSQYERDGLTLTSCHDCQEPCYRYPCQSGLGTPTCSKTICPKCTELYRYLLAFGPEQPEQYELRRRFVAGHCPCCLRICLRSKCRQKSLAQLGGEAPVPHDSVSRQIVMSYHLARRLLPAVEQIMALHQEEARAARTTLDAAVMAEIGYVGGQRAPHSERALCNRCATCLENLHFHCAGCEQDICPICAREARQGEATATVKCTTCRTAMQPMRFLDTNQLAMLQHARQRLDAALGGGPSSSSGTCGSARIDAAASPLPRLLWNLCKGSCGCEHERAEWIEPHTDWVQELRQAAAFAARHAPAVPALQQEGRQGQQAPQPRGGPRLPPRRVKQQQQPPQQPQQQPAEQPLQQQQAQPLQQHQQQPLPPAPPQQFALQQPLQQQARATAASQAPAAASGPVGAWLWPMQQMKQLLATVQGQAAAASLPQAQQMLQHTLRLLFRGEEGKMPGWAASRAPWTPAELQVAQDYIQRLVDAQLPAPVQPPQPSVLLAQPQQPQLAQGHLQQQLPQQPQPPQQQSSLPNGTASGAASGSASQEGRWPKMVARPASQQSGGVQTGGWNAGSWVKPTVPGEQQQQQEQQQTDAALAAGVTQAAITAAVARQEQQEQQQQAQPNGAAQQHQQQQQTQANGAAQQQQQQQQQALGNGVWPAGIAEEGAEPRPKRQRKYSQKALDAAEDEEGARVSGQQRQQAARRAPAPAPVSGAPAGVAAAAAAGGQQQQQQLAAQVPKELSPLERDERQWWWLAEQLPPTDVRLASHRGTQDFIWTPHADQFAPDHPYFDRTIRIFQMLWERGEPIIVRGLRGSMGWTPEAMGRVCKESNSTKLQVIACSDSWSLRELTPKDFFERYKRCSGDTLSSDSNEPLPMLKLKDFPPTSDFKQVMARHNDDFLQLLNRCLPAYTHPTGGALNLACHLPWYTRLPDLGPKGYIAFGREEENEGEGDSVTKMHEDLSDAINIMLHVQHRAGAPPAPPRHGYAEAQAPGYCGAGAVWDLVRREDRPALRRFLADALAGKIEGCPPFVHKGRVLTPADVHDVMHDQCFMLTAKHRALLAREPYGVHVWHVEQYEHEAVWIPGGCAHQVRNLRSSIKVALDFVSPDAVHECLELRGEFRQGAKKELELWQAEHPGQLEEDVGSRHYADKLQIGNMVLFGFLHSLEVLETVAEGRFDAIPRFPPLPQQPWKDPEEEAAAGGKPRRARQRQGGEEEEVEGEEGWEAQEEEGGGPSRGGGKRRR